MAFRELVAKEGRTVGDQLQEVETRLDQSRNQRGHIQPARLLHHYALSLAFVSDVVILVGITLLLELFVTI